MEQQTQPGRAVLLSQLDSLLDAVTGVRDALASGEDVIIDLLEIRLEQTWAAAYFYRSHQRTPPRVDPFEASRAELRGMVDAVSKLAAPGGRRGW